MSNPTVLVIGGGVAGSSCALTLSRLGVPVELAEKASFPRTKVCGCCIGPAGLSFLERLGLGDEAISLGVTTNQWSASLDRRRIDLPIPPGLVISRDVLDPLIIDAAISAGAKVRMNCEAKVLRVDSDGVGVRFSRDGNFWETRYEMVVFAAGLSAGGLDRILPWTERPHGPFGFSCTAAIKDVRAGVIYMACQDDGYVGLVRLADGKTDIAAALQSGSMAAKLGTPVQRVARILCNSAFDFEMPDSPDDSRTTPPLRRSRLSGKGRLLAIGDAAGYVEPFTGEGMTWAMHSGIAASELIAEVFQTRGVGELNAVGERWTGQLSRLLRRKKFLCRTVTSCLGNPFLRSAAGHLLSAVPQLSHPILRSLNRV